MVGDDAADDGEAKARAATLRGVVGLEEVSPVLGQDAAARVQNLELDRSQRAVHACRHSDSALPAFGLVDGRDGVVDQVQDNALDLLAV